jgi:hypothetical protein
VPFLSLETDHVSALGFRFVVVALAEMAAGLLRLFGAAALLRSIGVV